MHALFASIHSLSLSFSLSLSLSLPLSHSPYPSPLSHTHTTEAPSIRDPVPEQNRTVQIDETLMIPVTVDGVPSPTITWRKDSTELIDGSGRVSVSDTGALTVIGVTQYDRGNYSLSLSNTGGNLTRYFSVFVPCE